MKAAQRAKTGFTVIELLTVIAILALLAAILFPTLARVRESARQGSTITQMREIYTAVKLYREDNNKYPATLLGYVQSRTNPNDAPQFFTGSNGQPIPIEGLTYRPLTVGQRYLKDKDVFVTPVSETNNPNEITQAVYPLGVPLADQPVVFNTLIRENCCRPDLPLGERAHFYLYDNMTVGPRVDVNGNRIPGVVELHYSLDWTGGSGANDPPNQLKYPDPPQDTTVLNWVTHHAAVSRSGNVMVMMLSGKVNPVPLSRFYASVNGGPLNFNFVR